MFWLYSKIANGAKNYRTKLFEDFDVNDEKIFMDNCGHLDIGGRRMTDIERKFNIAMREIYETAKKECGYNAVRFMQLVAEKGGVAAAKQLISKNGGTDGFATLWEHGRLDLSVEAHVLKAEYSELFTDDERKICRDRLSEFGFKCN